MTIVEVLEGMLDLLDSPEKWCRDHAALDEGGHDVDYNSPRAVSWCLAGAMAKVCGSSIGVKRPQWDQDASAFITLRAQKEQHQVSCIPDMNDHKLHDYEDMRMFLKRALLEAEELNI